MSWSSGSRLVADILTDIQEEVDLEGVDDLTLRHIYSIIIRNFINFDCDTLDECLDIDPEFDKAYAEYYPDEEDDVDWEDIDNLDE